MGQNDIKRKIIENYIDWFTQDINQRERMKDGALAYIVGGSIDELGYIKEALSSIVNDATMALSGEWDCSTDEGKEGFQAQIDTIDGLGIVDVDAIVDGAGEVVHSGQHYPTKRYRGYVFAGESLANELEPFLEDEGVIEEGAKQVYNSIAYFFDDVSLMMLSAKELYEEFDRHS